MRLVELRQRAFGIGGCHAHQRDHPHPEDCTGSAKIERHRNTRDIAGADPRGEGDGQRLKGRYPVLVALTRADDTAEHFAKVAELDEAQANGEISAHRQQPVNEDIAPEHGVQKSDQSRHACLPLLQMPLLGDPPAFKSRECPFSRGLAKGLCLFAQTFPTGQTCRSGASIKKDPAAAGPSEGCCATDQAARAALAWAAMALNASGSCTARSARTLRSTSIPAFARPLMKRE